VKRSSTPSVYALFAEPQAAQRAVDGLRANGVADDTIVVMSSEPLDAYEIGQRDSATRMHWIAAAGGALGLAGATTLLVTTQRAWPIVTSAMPIVAWWPNLIIMFELTMLGAILATVLTLLVTAFGPGRARASFYDPEVSDGYILVGIQNPPDAARLTEALSAAGGRVKTTQ
jgi:hypothetical protein